MSKKETNNCQFITKYYRDDELDMLKKYENYDEYRKTHAFSVIEHSIYKVVLEHHQKEDTYSIISINHIGTIIYHYLRGSHSYNLATETSDEDYGGVFIIDEDCLYGLGDDYVEQVNNETNDVVFYELSKFLNLLAKKTNPMTLESLFVPERCVVYEAPLMTDLKKHRDEFLTKLVFPAFIGYAFQQKRLALSQKKKCFNPVENEPLLLNYVYCFYKQGSANIQNWLGYKNMNQKYCGLVNVNNMENCLSCFYDFGMQFYNENITCEELIYAYLDDTDYDTFKLTKEYEKAKADNDEVKCNEILPTLQNARIKNMAHFIAKHYHFDITTDNIRPEFENWYNNLKVFGYKGICKDTDERKSMEVRLSSVEKGAEPICYVHFNPQAFSSACKEWKDYQDWKKHRNVNRWAKVEEGKRGYDGKNMMHTLRLVKICVNLARNSVFNIEVNGEERDTLLAIKKGEYDVEKVFELMDKAFADMDDAIEKSTIPDTVNVDWVNDWLIEARRKCYDET